MNYLFTFFFLIAAHYVPMDRVFSVQLPHPIRMILNYVIGTVGMLLPYALWLYERNDMEALTTLAFCVVAAGMAPVFAYGLDIVLDWRNRALDAEEREALLLKCEHGAPNEG